MLANVSIFKILDLLGQKKGKNLLLNQRSMDGNSGNKIHLKETGGK